MASVRTLDEYQEFFDRMNEVLKYSSGGRNKAGMTSQSAWTPINQATNGSWVDIYNKDPVKEIAWAAGHPTSDPCAILVIPWKGLASYQCNVNIKVSFIYCPCHFPVLPHLTLRGLCPDSHIDQSYLARNDPVTGFLYFYGSHKTIAQFDGKRWKMLTAFFNTSASTDARPDTFILGKHSWSISGDSEECHSGKPYTTKLKLTGCSEGEFTCDDGQCIKMVERCNQVPDCRDESDEDGCQLIVFKNNYNKNIPPIKQTVDSGSIPAQVSISITLMKVVEGSGVQ